MSRVATQKLQHQCNPRDGGESNPRAVPLRLNPHVTHICKPNTSSTHSGLSPTIMSGRQLLIAYCTLSRKEIHRFMRIWQQTLFPPVITTTLYFLIFGNLIGARIGEMDGYKYIEFIVPGLILMSVITSSYTNTASSFFSAKFQKSIEEIQVSPMPNAIMMAGYVTGGAVRGIIIGTLVTIVSMLFSSLHIHNPFILLSVVVLTAVLFSLGGMLNGIFARTFDDVSIIPTFILTPLTYLGGIFYSIKLLPDFWQNASLLNPILYMINVFRYGFLGSSDIPVLVSYAIIFVFMTVMVLGGLHLLNRGYGIRS